MRSVEVRFFPICWTHGERPWWASARALDVRCEVCGRTLDTFQPQVVRVAGRP